VRTISASIMDTFDLNDQWTVFAGVRADRFDFELETRNANTLARTAKHGYKDTLYNGQVGVTYKINPMGMVYASFAMAADINGGESDVGTNSGYGGLMCDTIDGTFSCSEKPEKSKNFEVGTKWNLLDDKLLLTGAIFQTTKSDVMEGADYDIYGTFNTGKNRVRGVELGLVGQITPRLVGQVGLAFMDSKVLKSTNEAAEGKTLSNFADNSLSAQLKYEVVEDFSFGVAAKYESKRYGGQPDTAAAFNADGDYSQPVPAYTVFDLFATYRFNKNLDVRLNVNNVTDKDYYTAVYRSGSFLYKGDGRTARLTFNYDF
jgi:catecholate siderophore receptor